MYRKSLGILLLMAVSVVSFSSVLFAQETMSAKQLKEILDRALPKWSERMLKVQNGKDWTEDLDFPKVFRIMGDDVPKLERIPDDARRVEGDGRIVTIDRSLGMVKYVNRERAWNLERDAKSRPIEKEAAERLVMTVVRDLGIPPDEISEPAVETQVAAGAPIGEKEIKDRFEMYRVVAFKRTIASWPVHDSKLIAAVTNDGRIQRLQAKWPTFRQEPDLKLLSREEVIDRAIRDILEAEPEKDIRIETHLAYAPFGRDDEEVTYAPSVIIAVYSGSTPYQLVVPVVDTVEYPRDKQ